MADVQITDNSAEFLRAASTAAARALEIIGEKAEMYAKGLCPVDTGALRNSITHRVDGDTVSIGSAVSYAPYIELGTGKEYQPPPSWMENNAQRGAGVRQSNIHPRPYLRPAIENRLNEYKAVIDGELKKG